MQCNAVQYSCKAYAVGRQLQGNWAKRWVELSRNHTGQGRPAVEANEAVATVDGQIWQ